MNGLTRNGTLCCDCQSVSQSEITDGTKTCVCCDKSLKPPHSPARAFTSLPDTDCTESVNWIVYEKKIAISEAQLKVFVSFSPSTQLARLLLLVTLVPVLLLLLPAARTSSVPKTSDRFTPSIQPLESLVSCDFKFCRQFDQGYFKVRQRQPEGCSIGSIPVS